MSRTQFLQQGKKSPWLTTWSPSGKAGWSGWCLLVSGWMPEVNAMWWTCKAETGRDSGVGRLGFTAGFQSSPCWLSGVLLCGPRGVSIGCMQCFLRLGSASLDAGVLPTISQDRFNAALCAPKAFPAGHPSLASVLECRACLIHLPQGHRVSEWSPDWCWSFLASNPSPATNDINVVFHSDNVHQQILALLWCMQFNPCYLTDHT